MPNKLNETRKDTTLVSSEWDEISEGRDFVPSPIVFVSGDDGIPQPTCASEEEICEATEENVRCLHGPCDYYAERKSVKAATAGGIVTHTQRYCRALASCANQEPAELTDLQLSVCSRHRVDGVEHGDRAELLAMRATNYCRGCNQHTEIVMPDPDDPEDDEILDFCRLFNSTEALTSEVIGCTMHSEKKERDDA